MSQSDATAMLSETSANLNAPHYNHRIRPLTYGLEVYTGGCLLTPVAIDVSTGLYLFVLGFVIRWTL